MHPFMPMALALAMLIGFAAHRASLCTVRAVAEIMSSGTAWMPGSFLKAAAVNGGCSLSTLQRLADGDLSMLGTLAAFVSGVLAANELATYLGSGAMMGQATSFWQSGHALVLPILLWLWVLIEALRLWRSSAAVAGFRNRLLAPAYRLSSAAALLGVAAGLLYSVQGAWSYSNFLRAEAVSWRSDAPTPSAEHALLVVAMLVGLLMGVGGALVPGGNDTLILSTVPTGSTWALASGHPG